MARALRLLRITLLTASTLLVSCLLLSCAFPGATSSAGITIRHPPESTPLRPINVRSVYLNYSGVRLIDMPFFPNAGFNEEDKANFRVSLRNTLKAASRWHEPTGEEIRVYVVIKKHFIGWSREYSAAMAGFAWCAADPAGKILFQEQFYGTNRCTGLCNVGEMKDHVNHAAIRRIATKAVSLASGGGESDRAPVPGTYDSFEAAARSVVYGGRSWESINQIQFATPGLKMKEPTDWADIVIVGKPELAP